MESTHFNESSQQEDTKMEDLTEQRIFHKELIAKKLKQEGKDSAQNSDEEDHEREAREAREEKENQELINYNFLGSEECPVSEEMDEIEYSMIFRIPRIEALDKCTKLRVRY